MATERQHPLIGREVTFIQDWDEWKNLWATTSHVEILHSLLHVGFSVMVHDEVGISERILLYLDIADSHLRQTFQSFKEYPAYDSRNTTYTPLGKGFPGGALKVVAQKAFICLCQHFFSSDRERENYSSGVTKNPFWARNILQPGVMEKVLWFFRNNDTARPLYPGHCPRLYNADSLWLHEDTVKPHHIQVARQFASEFVQFIWCHDRDRDVLDGYKARSIDLLFALDELDVLLEDRYLPLVDDTVLKRLEELAMHQEMPYGYGSKARLVLNLRESCFTGNKAARVLQLLNVTLSEQKRLEKIAKLESEKRRTEAQLKQLSGRKV